jgi:hypothetical protein
VGDSGRVDLAFERGWLSERRNRIVHDVWVIEEESGELYTDKSLSPKTTVYGLQRAEDAEFETTSRSFHSEEKKQTSSTRISLP